MKKISILGSTGSIGVNTLDVIERNPGMFEVWGLAAGSNVDLFAKQIKKFKPKAVSLFDISKVEILRELLGNQDVEVFSGEAGSVKIATLPEARMVVTAMVGSAGLVPTLAAIRAGKRVYLSGVLGNTADNKGNPEAQTRETLERTLKDSPEDAAALRSGIEALRGELMKLGEKIYVSAKSAEQAAAKGAEAGPPPEPEAAGAGKDNNIRDAEFEVKD